MIDLICNYFDKLPINRLSQKHPEIPISRITSDVALLKEDRMPLFLAEISEGRVPLNYGCDVVDTYRNSLSYRLERIFS